MDELILNFDSLMTNAEKNRARYLSAKPFPNIMFDNFLPNQILEKVISEFPPPDANLEWRKYVVKSDDEKIGSLLEQFSESSVLICSDHGDCWGEDGLWEHGIFHEKVLEVPLIIRLNSIPIS